MRAVLTAGIAVFILICGALLLLWPPRSNSKPLGEAPLIIYQHTSAQDKEVRDFLEADFAPITRVESLPDPVRQAFTETGGSRSVMANPGQRFEATDVIRDESLPRKRLIFAGISGNKCFVHYEQGGLGLSYPVAFFELTSSQGMTPIWRGGCGKAKDLDQLRSLLKQGCK